MPEQTKRNRILLSAWGGNGGVDAVVEQLRAGLESKGFVTDLIYHNHKTGGSHLVDRGGERRYLQKFSDLCDALRWDEYAVLNLHTCNFSEEKIARIRQLTQAPIIHHAHGLIAHVAYVEDKKVHGKTAQEYADRLRAADPDHMQENMEFYRSWKSSRLQEIILREADKLVFLTGFTKDLCRLWYPQTNTGNNRAVIIPNGSDFHKYNENTAVDNLAGEFRHQRLGRAKNVIMFSGRITPPKGSNDLARAFDMICDFYPDTRLLLVGEVQAAYGGMEALMENIRPKNRDKVVYIEWEKSKQRIAAYLKASDVLAIPSYHETFSVAALEAMFMGTPVIMGDVDGSHEVYVEPSLAYGMNPGDVDRMVRHFRYIFSDPGRSAKNARHVGRVVNKKYRSGAVLDKIIEAYGVTQGS